jgi:hypothetical protein
VELKILDEGRWNLRCPGIGCKYQLVSRDVEHVLSQSLLREKAMQKYRKLCSESGTERLKQVLTDALADPGEAWALRELQACPRCLILARRQDGCAHLVCRCGCDFCFGCGAPFPDHDDEDFGCLCNLEEDGSDDNVRPRLAAWLSIFSSDPSLQPCLAKLGFDDLRSRKEHEVLVRRAMDRASEEEQLRHEGTLLSAWLWRAGAAVFPPAELPGDDPHEAYAILADTEGHEDPFLSSDWDGEVIGEDTDLVASAPRTKDCKRAAPQYPARPRRSETPPSRDTAAALQQEARRRDARQKQQQQARRAARQAKRMLF